jgi:hypothetical protein
MTDVELSDRTPAQPVEVLCYDRYYADLRDRFAFIFQVIETDTRFTIYTTDGERFHVGNTYRMLLTGPTAGGKQSTRPTPAPTDPATPPHRPTPRHPAAQRHRSTSRRST